MERPNNSWINPVIAATTVGVAALSLNEQKKTQNLTEQDRAYHKRIQAEEAASRQLLGVTSVRRSVEEKIITEDEGLKFCKRLGIGTLEECFGEQRPSNLEKKGSETRAKTNARGKTSKKNSKKDLNDYKSQVINSRNYDKNSLEKPHQLGIDFLNWESNTGPEAVTAEYVCENGTDLPENNTIFVHEVAEPFHSFSSSSQPTNSSLVGLGAAALVLGVYFIGNWLKKKNPTLKKYFTSNDEYFLESQELIHEKLDKIIENQKKNNLS